MIINDVLNLVETALYEISQKGGLSATSLTDQDFNEIHQFLNVLEQEANERNTPISLRVANASINILRTNSAQNYLFGKASNIKASRATTADRADDEGRISKWAGPERDRRISDERAEQVETVARALEKMNHITLNDETSSIKIEDTAGLSRIRNFLQIAVDRANVNSLKKATQEFDYLKQVYQNVSEEKFSPKEEPFKGASTVKMLTPNILIFLARVARNYSRKQSWDKYLNPDNFSEKSGESTGFFEYDPHEAANDLESMGLAIKTEQGYRLNKEKIQQTVKSFREQVVPKIKGSKLEAPTDKTGNLSQQETKAKEFIEFMRSSFSDKVWANAQKHVFSKLREAGGAYEKALEWYLGARDNIGSNDDSKISTGLEKIDKTFVGTAIQFVTAKFLARRMDYEAARILGSKPQRSQFITSRDIAPIARAYSKGFHKRPARI